jgi:hypothetical protein
MAPAPNVSNNDHNENPAAAVVEAESTHAVVDTDACSAWGSSAEDHEHRSSDDIVPNSRRRGRSTMIRARSNSMPAEEVTLEDRVIDLELKLATLSRLLQQQRRDVAAQGSPSPLLMAARSVSPPPPPAVLLMNDVEENTASIPYLESPCPSRRESSGVLNELGQTTDVTGGGSSASPKASSLLPQRKKFVTINESSEQDESTAAQQQQQQEEQDSNGAIQQQAITTEAPTTPIKAAPILTKAFETPRSALKQKKVTAEQSSQESPPPPPPPSLNDAPPDTTPAAKSAPPKKSSIQDKWMNYLNTFQESTPDVDVQMEEFIRVPSQVEYLLGFGWTICVDCFLYVLTILLIRFVWSCILLLVWAYRKQRGQAPPMNEYYRFHRRHVYQLIQVGIIYTVYRFLLVPISIGKLYHWIRGQAMLKLYVLIAIVEVFDRLFCSLGQDCLDSMYWNTTRRPKSSRMCISILVVLCYAACHSLILFVHVATLNVAMNSADQALLALLISGNFAEIKSTVFKKYNKANLFKIAAGDICERFKLALFLSLVLVLNMSQGMEVKSVLEYVKMCGIVWLGEVLSDWIKHSFITKFNYIPSNVYPEYALLLAGDVTGIGHEGVNLDNSHAVVKRIGLAQIPLVCVLLRYLAEAARYALPAFEKTPRGMVFASIVGIWCFLLALKITLGAYLQRLSYAKLHAAPELSYPHTPSKKSKRD